MDFASGVYIGNLVDDRVIYTGFQPKLVIIISRLADDPTDGVFTGCMVYKTDQMAGTLTFANDNAANPTNCIKSLDSTGFTLGTDDRVNGEYGSEQGPEYHWAAFGGTGIETGSYSGNSTDDTDISLSNTAKFVAVKGDGGANYIVHRYDAEASGYSFPHWGAIAETTGYIKDFDASGTDFRVSDHAQVNATGQTYYWWSFYGSAIEVSTFTGNATRRTISCAVSFGDVHFLLIKNATNRLGTVMARGWEQGESPNLKPRGYPNQSDPQNITWRMNPDAAGAVFETNQIEGLGTDSFDIGEELEVNENSVTMYYLALTGTLQTTELWVTQLAAQVLYIPTAPQGRITQLFRDILYQETSSDTLTPSSVSTALSVVTPTVGYTAPIVITPDPVVMGLTPKSPITRNITTVDIAGWRWAVILVEIHLDSGTVYYSSIGVRHPTRYYKPLVQRFGNIRRSLPIPPGIPVISDMKLTLINKDNEFSKIKASEPLKGKTVVIKIGAEEQSEASFFVVYTGRITDSFIRSTGLVDINVRDFTFDSFEKNPFGIITPSAFNYLPNNRPFKFRPIIYGEVSSVGKSGDGALPCPYIDTINYRYLVAQHPVKEVINVYRYGYLVSTSEYTVDEIVIEGRTHTVLTFGSDQEDPDRVTEEATITCDARGKTDTNLSSGTLITNPLSQLVDYMVNYADMSLSDMDGTTISETEQRLDTLGIVGAGAIVRRKQNRENITRFLQSANIDMYVNKIGKLSFYHFGTDDVLDVNKPHFRDDAHILKESFTNKDNDKIRNQLVYNYDYHWAKDYFYSRPTYDDVDSQANINEILDEEINLYFIRDDTDASVVVQDRNLFQTEENDIISFYLSGPQVLAYLELANIISVTHYSGVEITGSGYDEMPMKITELLFNLDHLHYIVSGVKLNIAVGRRMVLGDRSTLASSWMSADENDRYYAYLCDRITEVFGDGEAGKRLISRV